MQDNILVDESAEVPDLEGDGGGDDVTQDDLLSEPSEGEAVATGETDVIVLEESVTISAALASTTAAPMADSEW